MAGPVAVEVVCGGAGAAGCPAAGVRQRVELQEVVPGFVVFPALHCTSCGCTPVVLSGWPIGVTG